MDFSIDQLNAVEKEMQAEIQKIFKTANISCASEATESALMKLNKNPLAKFVNSLLHLVEKNVELCKSAAGTIDQLKTEKIADQKLLIEIQKGQINSVQETVKSEMKSWADVVKKNTSQAHRIGKPLTEKSIKQAVRTVNEEKRRSKNLMIYGFKEGDREDVYEIKKKMKDIIESTGVIPAPRIYEANRIGTKEQGKNRPIKIELESASEVDSILMQARNLKDFTDYEHVYLGPDRTKEDQLEHKKLVAEMKKMISRDPSKHYFIRQRKICTADKGLSS
ncbi:hypothetical protein ACHWQZ_G013180 [Mnemiopsis leidyi]